MTDSDGFDVMFGEIGKYFKGEYAAQITQVGMAFDEVKDPKNMANVQKTLFKLFRKFTNAQFIAVVTFLLISCITKLRSPLNQANSQRDMNEILEEEIDEGFQDEYKYIILGSVSTLGKEHDKLETKIVKLLRTSNAAETVWVLSGLFMLIAGRIRHDMDVVKSQSVSTSVSENQSAEISVLLKALAKTPGA